MEPEHVYRSSVSPLSYPGGAHAQAHALALNPPASLKVLEGLAGALTPPHNLSLLPARGASRRGYGAYDGLAEHCFKEAHKPGAELRWAYEACTRVIKSHSKSFYLSARMLPPGKREGITALYAFCRLSDDTVDSSQAPGSPRAIGSAKAMLSLNAWARATALPVPATDHPVVVAWADARNRFGIPQTLADELLAGIRMDLTIRRYDTWDDLWLYCYRVASTVGLMSLYITGAGSMAAVPYAVQLGVALQLTNILRDLGEDSRNGRIYLPAEDMARFGYTEEMLLSGTMNEQFARLMAFEIARARALYRCAWPGIDLLPRDSRLAVLAAGTLYSGILDKIERARYDVFSGRAHLTTAEKLRALPGLWLRSAIAEARPEAFE